MDRDYSERITHLAFERERALHATMQSK